MKKSASVTVKSSAPPIKKRRSFAAVFVTLFRQRLAPRQQPLQLVFPKRSSGGKVAGEFGQQMADIIVHVQVIGSGCLRDTVNHRTGLRTPHCVHDHPILSAYGKIPQCPLTRGIIDRHLPVSEKHPQVLLLVQAVSQTACRLTLGRYLPLPQRFLYPRKIRLNQRFD